MQRCKHQPLHRRRTAGFSLVEILLSLGIFAIGMTAIVSLFPAAAILQRETTQEVISEMAAQSAASIIEAQPLTYEWNGTASTGDLANYYSATTTNSIAYRDTDVVPFYSVAPTLITQRYSPADRSYPTGLLDGPDITDCDMHWVPFIQDLNGDPANPSWVVRLFILERDSRAEYTFSGSRIANPTDNDDFPGVRYLDITNISGNQFTVNPNHDLEPGDIVMDSNGIDYVISEVPNASTLRVLFDIPRTPIAPNKLWYAPLQGGSSSPAMRVVTVEVDVVAP